MKIEDVRKSLEMWSREFDRSDPSWFERALFSMIFVADGHHPIVDAACVPDMDDERWGLWVGRKVKEAGFAESNAVVTQLACIFMGVRWDELFSSAVGFWFLPVIGKDAVDVDIASMDVEHEEVFAQFAELSYAEVKSWATGEPGEALRRRDPEPPAEASIERLGTALAAIRDSEA